MFIPAKVVYWVAALCGLYVSFALFLSSTRGPITIFTAGMWVGTIVLLIAALLPQRGKYSYIDVTIRNSYRVVSTAAVFALLGSTVTTILLMYGIAKFVAFRLGYVHGKVQVGIYRPTVFDRLNVLMSKPIFLMFLISSVASLVIAIIILRRSGAPAVTETSGK